MTISHETSQTPLTAPQMLEIMSEENRRLGEYAAANPGKGYPESWGSIRQSTVEELLITDQATPDDVASYYAIRAERAEYGEKITGYSMGSTVDVLSYLNSGKLLAKGLSGNSDVAHRLRKDFCEYIMTDTGCLTAELQVLKEYYAYGKVTDLLGINPVNEFDVAIKTATRRAEILKWMHFNDIEPKAENETYDEGLEREHRWMMAALTSAYQLSPEDSKAYTQSVYKTIYTQSAFGKILNHFDHFGAPAIKSISRTTGIYGLEGYSTSQLELMQRLGTDPSSVAQELANHDVNLVLINRSGDHNGILIDVANDVDDGEQDRRSLFFEINNMQDVLRVFSKVSKMGIKPSTLWFAAHSAPGQFIVSDERGSEQRKLDILTICGRMVVDSVNTENSQNGTKEFGYALHGMAGVARAIETYMQPSRGIDDPSSCVGRKKIVFESCHMGDVTPMKELNKTGDKVVIGEESVLSQLAKDLQESGVMSTVDIYGAEGGIQMKTTPSGMSYSQADSEVFGERKHLDGIRMSVENGHVNKTVVTEVPIRK